jgi:formate dehydrogenase beta subunit
MELGKPDASGRRRPVPIKGSEFVMEADMIISAIGEAPDLSFVAGGRSINTTEQGTVAVDRYSGQTSVPGVFSGGDCVTGPATLIEAIAAGNRAARSIDQYLKSGKVTPSDEDLVEDLFHDIDLAARRDGRVIARKERQSPEELAVAERKINFNEVEQCFTPEAAAREAERCLRCYRVMLLAVAGEK